MLKIKIIKRNTFLLTDQKTKPKAGRFRRRFGIISTTPLLTTAQVVLCFHFEQKKVVGFVGKINFFGPAKTNVLGI